MRSRAEDERNVPAGDVVELVVYETFVLTANAGSFEKKILARIEFVLFAPRRRVKESITAVTPGLGETLNCMYTESI
jgi:hypothetical protein